MHSGVNRINGSQTDVINSVFFLFQAHLILPFSKLKFKRVRRNEVTFLSCNGGEADPEVSALNVLI